MKANLMNRTIEMSKSEAKAAGRIGSEKFKELKKYQRAYPDYTICVIEAPKRKSEYSGLNYKFMENHIKNCNKADDEKEKIMEEFKTLRGVENKNRSEFEKVKVASYLEVKTWFLKKFPEIQQFKDNHSKKLEDILNVA